MPPRASSARFARLPAASVAALLAVLLGACAAGAGASFDPQAPCTSDGQREGAYPELEALIPTTLGTETPDRLDSGRNCSPSNLGTLTAHGIGELRFAGGLWETGSRSGVSIAVFRADGLTLGRLAEFYERGAREARKTEAITTADHDVAGVDGWRLDTLNDESFQTIVLLAGPGPDLVRAVLVGSDIREIQTRPAHEQVVDEATQAALSAP